MAELSRARLQEIIRREYIKKRRLGELSEISAVSKTYLSQFANDRASWDTAELEAKLRGILSSRRKLEFRDERRLLAIIELLNECSDRDEVCRRISDEFISGA